MIKNRTLSILPALTAIALAMAARGAFAAEFAVPQLPQSPYDDTEISTNVAFSAGGDDARTFSLSLALDATPSNTLQLAFGRDVDSDGVLSWQETDFLLGWRCGEWFFRDKTVDVERAVPRNPGHRRLEWRVMLDGGRAPRGVSSKDGSYDMGFAVSPGMFNASWDLMRVTARGMPGPVYAADGKVSAPGFSIRMR